MDSFSIWNRMRKMQTEMDRLFEDFYGAGDWPLPRPPRALLKGEKGMPLAEYKHASPFQATADLYETDKEIVAKIDLPGANKEDIRLEISRNQLCVKAENKSEREEKKKDLHLFERSYSGYFRNLSLPPYAKTEGVKADYRDGVLTVRIPKGKKDEKGHEITIN